MPVEVTEFYETGTCLIRYGIEDLEWYEADSQAEALAILADIAKDRYISSIEWTVKH